MMPKEAKTRKACSLNDKLAILSKYNELPAMAQREAVKHLYASDFTIDQSALRRMIRNHDAIVKSGEGAAKKKRRPNHPELEDAHTE